MKKIFGAAIAARVYGVSACQCIPFGKRSGFRTGSEWAILQAAIVAREAGIALPLYLHDGAIRVVLRQPPGLYQKAWRLADRFEEANKERETEKQRKMERSAIVEF